jgi:hypothetical protein
MTLPVAGLGFCGCCCCWGLEPWPPAEGPGGPFLGLMLVAAVAAAVDADQVLLADWEVT